MEIIVVVIFSNSEYIFNDNKTFDSCCIYVYCRVLLKLFVISNKSLYIRLKIEFELTHFPLSLSLSLARPHCIQVDILDTSGDQQFPAMRRLSIATAHAFLLVYSTTSGPSFSSIKKCFEEIREQRADYQVRLSQNMENKFERIQKFFYKLKLLDRFLIPLILQFHWQQFVIYNLN